MTNILESKTDKMNYNLVCSHKIFRYKFEKEIVDLLMYFAKLHKYDNKDDYKEAWNTWFELNNDILERESRRIINLGYDGNVEQKMYKSARYYFRRKCGGDAQCGGDPQTPQATLECEGIVGDSRSTLEEEDKSKD